MAIIQAACVSAKVDLLTPLTTAVLKIALYTSSATLDYTTTAYTTSSEVVGVGYTAGGQVLTGVSVTYSGTTAWLVFTNPTWVSSTITARGALIYNSSSSNKAIAVLDFGIDKVTSGGNFVIQFPASSATTAIVRIV